MKLSFTVVFLSLVASRTGVLAVPYDSYPTSGAIISGDNTSASSSNTKSGLEATLNGIGDSFQRAWEGMTCLAECRKSWGWTGAHFGADPWGGVINAGDPVPYVQDSNQAQANTPPGDETSSSAVTSTKTGATSSDGGAFGVLDFTSTTRASPTSTAPFSVFNVPTIVKSSSSTSSESPTSSDPPPPPTTSSTPDEPSPTPTPETTTQQASPDPSPAATTQNSSGNNSSGGSTSGDDQAQYLKAHNDSRQQHGANPVTWSNDLENIAQQWANNCQFQHSGGRFKINGNSVGENLAAGTGNYQISQAVADWVDEVKDYHPEAPEASHFTQVVWKATTQIGCAKSTCSGIFSGPGTATYYVCEYFPAGNVVNPGQFDANVQK